jgi:L-2-hydroxyglutarate oxidase LhgO
VPDLRNPFLGVHFTLTVQGRIKIGPTVIPAFWPEQYGGLEGFVLRKFLATSGRHLRLIMAGDAVFRELAVEEMKKYSRGYLVDQAALLAQGVRKNDFRQWGKPGIRAQLFNRKTGKLEMDFVIEGDNRSMHVLNAVSPAFTCSLPFSRYVRSDQPETGLRNLDSLRMAIM